MKNNKVVNNSAFDDETLVMDMEKYDYDPYVLFNDWSDAVYSKLGYKVFGAIEEECINENGEKLMMIDGVLQEFSVFMFFTELMTHLGIYGDDGYKTMDVECASNLLTSSCGIEETKAMFELYNIKVN